MPKSEEEESSGALQRLVRLRERYGELPRVQREAVVFGAALLVGLLVMPFLIWFAGNRVLGPYTHGQNAHAGPFALFGDYFVGLAHGSMVFWVVALGPAALLLLLRLFLALLRVLPVPRDPRPEDRDDYQPRRPPPPQRGQ